MTMIITLCITLIVTTSLTMQKCSLLIVSPTADVTITNALCQELSEHFDVEDHLQE